MTKPKPRPARAVDAVRQALDDAARAHGGKQKPIEVVKTAFCAYQAFHFDPRQDTPSVESADRAGTRRGTQSSIDRLLFNVNYWLAAYEDRIVDACSEGDDAHALLRSIAAWNSHTMRLNTLSAQEAAALFERFCPPFAENHRKGDGTRQGKGKGPLRDFEQRAREISANLAPDEAKALGLIVDEVREEAHAYEAYADAPALDALYDLLPAWCLQDRIGLVRANWWNDADVMALLAKRLHDCFADLGFAQPLCSYYLDAMQESIDNYMRTVASEESPYRTTPVPDLIELVKSARAAHPDSEIEGYGNELPAWLDGKEQLIWNTVVCAIYGPMHTRPLLADDLGSLPVEGQPTSTDVVTRLAQLAYVRYVDIRTESGVFPSCDSFEAQPDDLRNSGLARIESIPRMLDVLGYHIVPLASCYPDQRIDALRQGEVECLAILEHRRWQAERAAAGWTYSPAKDVGARKSPYLVDWDDLPERVREWNRSSVRDIPVLLAGVGLAISR